MQVSNVWALVKKVRLSANTANALHCIAQANSQVQVQVELELGKKYGSSPIQPMLKQIVKKIFQVFSPNIFSNMACLFFVVVKNHCTLVLNQLDFSTYENQT